MPSLRAFEVLVAVADTGSVSGAARRLHLSQPAVSHQLTGLEREVGSVLVDRDVRGAVLTRRGRSVVEHARVAVAAAERATRAASADDAPEPIRVAVAESFTLPFILPVASTWNLEGRTRLLLTETSSAAVAVAELRAGDYDLVVVPGPVAGQGLRVRTLGAEAVVAVGRDIVAAGRDTLPLDLLPEHELVGVDAANGFGAWLAAHCAEAGVVYRPDVTVRSVQKAAAMAAAGFGTTLVPISALAPGMTAVPLTPYLDRAVVALTRSSRDTHVDELVSRIQQRVRTTHEQTSAAHAAPTG